MILVDIFSDVTFEIFARGISSSSSISELFSFVFVEIVVGATEASKDVTFTAGRDTGVIETGGGI